MANDVTKTFSTSSIPWQIWIVVVLLGLEGISNLLNLEILWLAAKVLFIIGLLRSWKWVYVVFLAIGALHVIYFAQAGAFVVSSINLILVILALWVFRHYFPKEAANFSAESL
jgi:hypothetical protein